MTYKCPKCGGRVVVDRSMVLASYPPKYRAVCIECGETSYPLCSEVTEGFGPEEFDSFLEKFSENLKAEQASDLTPNTITITPQSTETITSKQTQGAAAAPSISYGWVCPICGKVHAPWVKECDCNGVLPKTNTAGPLPGLDYPHYSGTKPNWHYDSCGSTTISKDMADTILTSLSAANLTTQQSSCDNCTQQTKQQCKKGCNK